MKVEVCANSLESALVAEHAGADRIELCSELAVGGLTPSYGLLKAVKEQVSIPVHVLIRPRSGDFTYSDDEMNIMLSDIELCLELGFDGIVSGVLLKDFSLDVHRTQKLKAVAGNLKFTFHRAFDWIRNPFEALAQLETMQVDYILSSGQQKSAPLGIEFLSELKRKSKTVQIMPGSGVNAENVTIFKNKGFKAVHLSGSAMVQTLPEIPIISMNSERFLSDDCIALTQLENIKAVVTKVK
ncbi:copper homeostasis protein CutC [Maribacter hydrothermalis]|uniref:PF03932 family protein CutC n=1 Tax=Maribacter hydrothermalis TaxID=1836467 RepID=A0A1B7ZFG7_9FLAO|nr:copper homeostasis protein CutC [Maribacter hydrothermalis]APQ17817.1 copper homeostasis protein CutC [Maribacter hydrothermalis]OBR42291.1 copper homeostasis protein CutC [Maribacter hydrothermalis]